MSEKNLLGHMVVVPRRPNQAPPGSAEPARKLVEHLPGGCFETPGPCKGGGQHNACRGRRLKGRTDLLAGPIFGLAMREQFIHRIHAPAQNGPKIPRAGRAVWLARAGTTTQELATEPGVAEALRIMATVEVAGATSVCIGIPSGRRFCALHGGNRVLSHNFLGLAKRKPSRDTHKPCQCPWRCSGGSNDQWCALSMPPLI